MIKSVTASTKIPKELKENIENLKPTLNKVSIKGIVKTIRKDRKRR